MNWFKHLTFSASDPDFIEAELKFKANGPYVFWRTLEILARENAINEPLSISWAVYKSFFPVVNGATIERISRHYAAKNRLSFILKDNLVTVFCQKLAELSSDYTKKSRSKSGQWPKSKQNNTVTEEEEEVRSKNKKPHNPLKGVDVAFDKFWEEYPKKVGKGAARRAWNKIKKPVETLPNILSALKWQKQSEQWRRDSGQYIPNPATYINQTRWQDEPPEAARRARPVDKCGRRDTDSDNTELICNLPKGHSCPHEFQRMNPTKPFSLSNPNVREETGPEALDFKAMAAKIEGEK